MLQTLQDKLAESIAAFTAPANEQSSLQAIEQHFSYQPEDVKQWWSGVRWVQDQRAPLDGAASMKGQSATTKTVSKAVLTQTLDLLEKAGVLKAPSDGWKPETFVKSAQLAD